MSPKRGHQLHPRMHTMLSPHSPRSKTVVLTTLALSVPPMRPPDLYTPSGILSSQLRSHIQSVTFKQFDSMSNLEPSKLLLVGDLPSLEQVLFFYFSSRRGIQVNVVSDAISTEEGMS